jgi:hypothetical protein
LNDVWAVCESLALEKKSGQLLARTLSARHAYLLEKHPRLGEGIN